MNDIGMSDIIVSHVDPGHRLILEGGRIISIDREDGQYRNYLYHEESFLNRYGVSLADILQVTVHDNVDKTYDPYDYLS